MNDTKSMERGNSASPDNSDQHLEEVSRSAPEPEFHEPGTVGLPFAPACESGQAQDKPDDTLRQLLAFYLDGPGRTDTAAHTNEDLPSPALLYQYRDLSRVRHDFPVCLHESDPDSAARSLTSIIDELIAGIADDSDTGQRIKQHIYRLEAEIRRLTDRDHDAGLLGLWDRAAKKLISSSKHTKEKKKLLRENLGTARRALDIDYETIACDADAPVRLLSTLAVFHWQQRCKDWREQLELLIRQLQDILSVDFDHSVEAKSPDHLREATSTDDIDFDAMASILATDHLAAPIEKSRSDRLHTTLETLQRIIPLFYPLATVGEEDPQLPFSIRTIFDDCSAAVEEYQLRMRIMTDFFKAVGIARLEAENRYREERYDEYFERYDISQLTAAERALCPPVLLCLTSHSLKQGGIKELLEILGAGLPIKVLLVVDNLYECKQTANRTTMVIDWPVQLANMVMAMNQVYVLQSPVSNLPFLRSGLLDGLGYEGPALFSIYSGGTDARTVLPAYLDAASAAECRTFPLFSCNPGNGQTQVQRMDVAANSQCDRDWPAESFTYRTENDDEVTIEASFTLADFLLCDRRCATQFRNIPVPLWHENMLPLHDYLMLDAEAARTRIPYLLTVDEAGRLGRVIMTRTIVELVQQCSSFWHSLQELGGINNSYALRLLAQEQDRLADEMQQQVEIIEKKYTMQLDQDIGKLTGEIVQRIAGQLLQDAATGKDIPARTIPPPSIEPAPVPVPSATEQDRAVEEPRPEEEEDEIEGLDDPYIETPRCTSCDDCTKLNGLIFAYDDNKQAYIKDATAGPYKDLVKAAELCPVKIIHPGKPKNPAEAGLEELLKRAAPFM